MYLINFEKILIFGRKIHLPTAKNFEIYLPRWGDPQKITLITAGFPSSKFLPGRISVDLFFCNYALEGVTTY